MIGGSHQTNGVVNELAQKGRAGRRMKEDQAEVDNDQNKYIKRAKEE